jgi:hypothetical protein
MLPDIRVTPRQLCAAADWTDATLGLADVEMRLDDDLLLVVQQGDDEASFPAAAPPCTADPAAPAAPAAAGLPEPEAAGGRGRRDAWRRARDVLRDVEDVLALRIVESGIADLDDESLARRERAGWKRVESWMEALEPVVLERIARRVRVEIPEAVALMLEPTDQAGGGWVLASGTAVLADGEDFGGDDPRAEALSDDDELWRLLSDFGEFVSSETEPYPYRLELSPAAATAPAIESRSGQTAGEAAAGPDAPEGPDMTVPTAPARDPGRAPNGDRPSVHAIFRHDTCGGQLLVALSDPRLAGALAAALSASAERDESYAWRTYQLDDLATVHELCAAAEIAVPDLVTESLRSPADRPAGRSPAARLPLVTRAVWSAPGRALRALIAGHVTRRIRHAREPHDVVYRYLDLSTVHVPQDALNGPGGLNRYDGVIAYAYEYGAWLWVPDDAEERVEDYEDVPAFVAAIWRRAQALGCAFVRLDADGPTSPALETFEESWR